MNVYDFDGTIYDGDSTVDFWFFCLKKKKSLFFIIPIQVLAFILYRLRIIEKIKFKEVFYTFIKYLSNTEQLVYDFWDENYKKIKLWYFDKKKSDDLVISASPYFLIKEACRRLEILNPIASDVDINSGKCIGENCYGVEKVKRFYELYPDTEINEFYSDSRSDIFIARLAKSSYLVKKNTIIEWSL